MPSQLMVFLWLVFLRQKILEFPGQSYFLCPKTFPWIQNMLSKIAGLIPLTIFSLLFKESINLLER